MQLGSQFSKPSFLESIDIFGIAIAIRFNSSPSHNTRFGGFITLGILGILFFQIISVLEVLFNQSSPQVIQSNDYTYQPESFKITPKTFNFAIGLQDYNFNQFMDETIYRVKGVQQNLIKTLNQTTGEYEQKWVINEINMVPCTEENFQIEDTNKYFLQQLYPKMYCFNINEDNAMIEGEFSAEIYRSIVLHFDEYKGDGCASQEKKMNYIQQPTLALFMSNNIIQIQNKYKPYQTIGKNLYWVSGPDFNKYITLNLVNNYINSDFALYGKKWKKDRVVSLSTTGESVLPRTSDTMFSLTIVYEKNLEINYYRSYLKIDQAFSQLGGLFNGLLAIGFLICKPLSQLELNRKLLNSIFNISQEDQEEIEKDQAKANKSQKKDDQPQFKNTTEKVSQQQALKESQKLKVSKTDVKNSQELFNQIKNQANTKKKEEITNDVNNFFKVQFSELQIKFRDYLHYYLRFFKRFQSVKQKIITYGTDKLYNQIDIFYIINKMIELEKLKHLLLNEHQIKLFEYLPRPQLKLQDMIEQEAAAASENQENANEKSPNMTGLNVSMNNPNLRDSELPKKQKNDAKFTIFALDDKDPLQKAQDAQRAFNYIQKKAQRGKKSQIDEKLVKMLDPKLVGMFKENSFDFGTQPIELDDDSDDNEGENENRKGVSVLKKSIFQPDTTMKVDKTIIQQEEDEENKDFFNISCIPMQQDKSQSKIDNLRNLDQLNQKGAFSLVQSQSISLMQSNVQNKSQIIQQGQNDNTDYLDSNNISFTQTPVTTNRQLNEKSQNQNPEKVNNKDINVNLSQTFEPIEEDKRSENEGNGIQIAKPSNLSKYFDNPDHHN